MDLKEIVCGLDSCDHDRNQWRPTVNTVKNLTFCNFRGVLEYLSYCNFEENLCFLQLGAAYEFLWLFIVQATPQHEFLFHSVPARH
jgi:hypothetical protein